ncbi:hypothetical protein DA2_2387 [Desulfovibrio sp. A2]|nr:hypothetical protein DA2_2387 [Desulfovibrio sp. A2]
MTSKTIPERLAEGNCMKPRAMGQAREPTGDGGGAWGRGGLRFR